MRRRSRGTSGAQAASKARSETKSSRRAEARAKQNGARWSVAQGARDNLKTAGRKPVQVRVLCPPLPPTMPRVRDYAAWRLCLVACQDSPDAADFSQHVSCRVAST